MSAAVCFPWRMAQRVQVRDLTNDEGRRLLAIVRRGTGSVVKWRRAQIVLWSAQSMDVPAIAKIAFTSEDRVREVIHNFNDDAFDSLEAKYAGGRPPKFTLPQRQQIKKIATLLIEAFHGVKCFPKRFQAVPLFIRVKGPAHRAA